MNDFELTGPNHIRGGEGGYSLFIYNTIQHSHRSDAERMEIGFRQDQKCHVNNEKYTTQHNKNKIKSA